MLENTHCLNCETPLKEDDNFCPKCGQKNRSFRIGFWSLTKEFLSNNFNFDTNLGRTVSALLLHPGKLTKEFNAGKRAQYVRPMQMYFFVSFVFFLLLGASSTNPIEHAGTEEEINVEPADSILNFEVNDMSAVNLGELVGNTDPDDSSSLDSLLMELGIEADNELNREVARRAVRMMDPEEREKVMAELRDNISIAMFFLMPLFAAFLWLFVRKMNPYYFDSLIFSIHYHTIVFVILSLEMAIAMAYDNNIFSQILDLTIVAYLLLSIKRVYGLSWMRSFTRTLALSFTYLLSFGVVWLSVLLLSFMIY